MTWLGDILLVLFIVSLCVTGLMLMMSCLLRMVDALNDLRESYQIQNKGL